MEKHRKTHTYSFSLHFLTAAAAAAAAAAAIRGIFTSPHFPSIHTFDLSFLFSSSLFAL